MRKAKEILSHATHEGIMGNRTMELMYTSGRINLPTRLKSVLENVGHLDA